MLAGIEDGGYIMIGLPNGPMNGQGRLVSDPKCAYLAIELKRPGTNFKHSNPSHLRGAMHTIDRLLLENKAWVQEKLEANPDFLEHLAQNRNPDIFWIGCSDSRLHADEITNSEPGEILVHRNVGNQVVSTDFNLLGALEYAVDVLLVKHIIVCGHYRCRSVKAALDRPNPNLPFADKWLRNIKDVYRLHRREIEAMEGLDERWKQLVELNIKEQINNLAHSSIIQKSWRNAKRPELHGWVYGLNDGIIRELVVMKPHSAVDPIYEYNLEGVGADKI